MSTIALIRENGYFINADGKKIKTIQNCTLKHNAVTYNSRNSVYLYVKDSKGETVRINTRTVYFKNAKNGESLMGKKCTVSSYRKNLLDGYSTIVTLEA